MQQNGDGSRLSFFFRNIMSSAAQNADGFTHQMHSAQCMVKPGMVGTRIDEVAQPQLLDTPESLHQRMLNEVENNFKWNRNKPVNRVVQNLSLIQTWLFNL